MDFFIKVIDNIANSFLKLCFLIFFIDTVFWREMVHPDEVRKYMNVIHDFFECVTITLYPQLEDVFYLSYYEDEDEDHAESDNHANDNKTIVKFEDKYLDYVRNMSKAYPFNDIQKEQINITMREFYRAISCEYLKQIDEFRDMFNNLKQELNDMEEYDDLNACDISSKKKECFDKIKEVETKIKELEEKYHDNASIEMEAIQRAEKTILDTVLDQLCQSYVMEYTPLGNVLMFYNNKKGTFEYHSDSTIPYRYLETVARKYVKFHNCRSIYFDMEEELKNYESKLIEKEAQEEMEKRKEKENLTQNQNPVVKKNVFAKFKDYNKDGLSGRVNTAPPPKNSIPSKNVTDSVNKQRVLLKENANRYTFEGKISNFNMLKKIPRKMVDKKYAMTFADFKKNVLNNNT
jgi:hypothetical protein